jgi:hypothetical protein
VIQRWFKGAPASAELQDMASSRLLAAALAASFLGACDASASPAADGGAGPMGGGASPGLVGTWLYAAGTTTRSCPGEAPTDAAPEGGLVIAAGNAGEVIVTEPGACSMRFSLKGNVATIVAGQTCSGADGAGGTITFSNMKWTLTASADGKTLTESLTADEKLAPATGAARTCKYTETGVTLRKS